MERDSAYSYLIGIYKEDKIVMVKDIIFDGISFDLIRSLRARNVRISIYPNCKVKVIAPSLVPEFIVKRFVLSKKEWITKKLDHFRKNPISKERLLLNNLGRKDFAINKEKALQLVKERLAHFNKHYGFIYNKITIRNQKSRWGSCSHNGNLNFNYKIVFLAPNLQDYIIVHELCHIKELNHSAKFWALVSETVLDCKTPRRELKKL